LDKHIPIIRTVAIKDALIIPPGFLKKQKPIVSKAFPDVNHIFSRQIH
jgi:hypothetical protein